MTADLSGSRGTHAQSGKATRPHSSRQLALPATPQAAGLARRATQDALTSWRMTHLEQAAVLIVSELVTNVVLHANAPAPLVILRLHTEGGLLWIDVEDADPCRPQPRTPASLDESGFGLVLVEALAGRWGVRDTPSGKAVWAELDTRPGSAS